MEEIPFEAGNAIRRVAILIVLEQGWKVNTNVIVFPTFLVAILIVLEQGWKQPLYGFC